MALLQENVKKIIIYIYIYIYIYILYTVHKGRANVEVNIEV